MGGVRAALVMVALATAGCDGDRTSIRVDVTAPGLSLTALSLAVGWDGQSRITTPLPPAGGPPRLPGSVLVLLPDSPLAVDVTLDGTAEGIGSVEAHASVMARPHQEVVLPLALSASPEPMADLAVAADLAGANDLAGADLGVAMDLSAPRDLAVLPDLRPNPQLQLGALTTGNSSLTASLPSASGVGSLVVFTFAFDHNPDPVLPANWLRYSAYQASNNAEIFYYPNNPGGITNATVMLTGATTSVGQMSEWQVGGTLDVGAWCLDSVDNTSPSSPCTTSMGSMRNGNNVMHAGDLVFSCFSLLIPGAGPATLTPSAGWAVVGDNNSASTVLHYQFSMQNSPPTGMPLSELPTSSVAGKWAGAFVSLY